MKNRSIHRKKIPLAGLVLFFTVLHTNAQEFSAGFFGGINVSQVSGDSYSGFNKLGFTGGVFVNRLIDKDFYWQAEIKYGTRGVYEGPTDGNPTLYKSAYHILELPLSVNYLFDDRIMVELGTSPEVLLTTRFYDENGLMDKSSYPDNRTIGLSVFAGISYWFNPQVMAGLRYTNSAIPFRDPEEWNNPQYRGHFHNVISLTMAYRFKQP